MNIVERIFNESDRRGTALIAGGEQVTYGRLIELADAGAVAISKVKGTRIGLDCPNGIAHVVLALAILRAGKCLVPLASELAPPERERLIRETAISAIMDVHGSIEELAPPPELHFEEGALAAMDPAFIRFSSGTTGKSKGVVLSHRRLLERVTAANRGLNITPRDRVIWILPMAHHFAVSIMLYLLQGATIVIAGSNLAEDVLAAAWRHRGTVLYGAPFHHGLLAADPSDRPWPELRLAVSTAATLPLKIARAFDARFGVPLSQGLGIIEVGLPLLNLQSARAKPGSIGRPLPDYEVRVEGEGELLLRGPGMFDAYLQPWRDANDVLDDGWFRTGDFGRIDEDGDVHLLGRSHSVINVAGLKCFPEEIEAVLCEIPGVAAARVIGQPHGRFGTVPVAEILPCNAGELPSLALLSAHCRGALARYKVPAEFRFVESLPLTANGKIQR